jgi:hypothetical protein
VALEVRKEDNVLVPIYGFLRGDTLGLLVLVHDHEPVSAIAAKLQQAAAVRVAPFASARVIHEGRLLDPAAQVGRSGIEALDRVDVVDEQVP